MEVLVTLLFTSLASSSVSTLSDGILSIPLNYVQNGYVANVGVGTPVQSFAVEISTTHSGLWVASAYCGQAEDQTVCGKSDLYNKTASATFQDQKDKVLAFIDNSPDPFYGVLSKDAVTLTTGTIEMKLNDVNFGRMLNVAEHYYYATNVTGSLGFGFSERPYSLFDNVIDSLYNNSLISTKVVGLNFKKVQLETNIFETFVPNAGTIDIYNVSNSNVTWIDSFLLKSDYHDGARDYLLPIEAINLNGKPLHCKGGCKAAIDASSFMIKLPEKDSFTLNTLLGFIPFMGGAHFTDCKRLDYLPNVDVHVTKDIIVSLSPQDYLVRTKPPSPILYSAIFVDEDDVKSYGSIDDEDDGMVCMSRFFGHDNPDLIVLGQPFLQNIYTLLDFQTKSYGFIYK